MLHRLNPPFSKILPTPLVIVAVQHLNTYRFISHYKQQLGSNSPLRGQGLHVVLSKLHDMDFGESVGKVIPAELMILQCIHQGLHKLVQESDLQRKKCVVRTTIQF